MTVVFIGSGLILGILGMIELGRALRERDREAADAAAVLLIGAGMALGAAAFKALT